MNKIPKTRADAKSLGRLNQRTPPWLSGEHKREIGELYAEARAVSVKTGVPHQVDHIMPINGETSSGLHVPWNLQILTAKENRVKSNLV
jgi:5-methylcytosine-specific restriction endonuclease McrA